MKALLLEEIGKWKDMEIKEVEAPTPQKDELLIRVKAAGLNPVDYKTGENGYPDWEFPHVLGLDVAGTVEAVGEEVAGFNTEDHVVFLNNMSEWGGFAEFAVVKAHVASKIPYNVVFEDAAALPVAGYTAYQALFDKLHVQAGDSILIHAGAGGVGGFAIQLAKNAGLTVYTTASEENHEYVKELGADKAIDYSKESFVEKILEETEGLGVDHVLDTVGRENATASLEVLAYNGQIAFIAGPPKMDDSIDFGHPKSFHHVALGSVFQSKNIDDQLKIADIGTELLDMLSNGKLKARVTQKIPMVDVPKGLEQLSTRKVRGKIVAVW